MYLLKNHPPFLGRARIISMNVWSLAKHDTTLLVRVELLTPVEETIMRISLFRVSLLLKLHCVASLPAHRDRSKSMSGLRTVI